MTNSIYTRYFTLSSKASVWHIESKEGTTDEYYLYTYVGETKMYVSHNPEENKENEVALVTENGDAFTIGVKNSKFSFKRSDNNKYLQHYKAGNAIRFLDGLNEGNGLFKAELAGSYTIPDDFYKLDGKSYGLMYYTAGSTGNAFMADETTNYQAMVDLITRENGKAKTYHVSETSDVTKWTFHSTAEDKYNITTEIDGITKYLKIDNTGISFVDEASENTIFTVTPGTGDNSGKIKLTANGKTLCYNANSGFIAGSNNSCWLNFIGDTDLPKDSYIAFTAEKVGVSEVNNGDSVIIYTRVWNDSDPENPRYDFYAVDHQGKLVRCYERGDNIMWVGNQIDTLEWDFTEYYWEGTNEPNYYYELYNTYSKKYLAPQLDADNLLSNDKIGINLPGRRDGEYYTDIIAWDDSSYAYAGIKADVSKGEIVSTKRKEAETFYFASIKHTEKKLTTVETIDNNLYGITMKVVDFEDKVGNNHNIQDQVLGDNTKWEDHKYVPLKNLLTTNIEDGYPKSTSNGRSLSELFGDATVVNNLFISSTYEASGYFEYDSCQNFASLIDPETGQLSNKFTVYKELGTMSNATKDTLKHGQFMPFNTIKAGVYSTNNPQNIYDATAKILPDSDPRKYEKLHEVKNPDYYNGLELSASFTQTASGKDAWGHDIIFEFTGDDDFWLYVDDELVIDLGGIHSALPGSVNFSTGAVSVNGVESNLREVFENNYRSRNPGASDKDVADYLAKYFDEGSNKFKDYSSHTMRVFYMERGAGASNLHMRFNLSYVTPGHVTFKKKISGTDKLDFDLVEYPYQIWYRDKDGKQVDSQGTLLTKSSENVGVTYQNSTKPVDYIATGYKPIGSDTTYDSVFLLTPDKAAELHFPSDTFEYRIIECGMNEDIYKSVSVNGSTPTPIDEGNGRFSYDSGWLEVDTTKNVVFDNEVDEEGLRSLKIKKELYDAEGNLLSEDDDPTTFGFRLYLSNGVSENLELASMYKYRVIDDEGYYCRWDKNTEEFISVGVKNFLDLPDTIPEGQEGYTKEDCTFETSMNGTISKIPPSYTVEVPILPVDMKYKLEERTGEIPLGYKLVEYKRTDTGETSDVPIEGIIHKEDNPFIVVKNQRGWEIEVTKEWSDKDFTTDHDAIYTAAYVGDTLIPGTVRRMKYPKTSFRYFFEKLEEGSTFDQYSIREVELTNPTIDADGITVTGYDSIQYIHDGEFTKIYSKAKGSDTSKQYWYNIGYEQGEPTGVVSGGNVREDSIENTRGGGIVMSLYEWGSQDLTEKKALPGGVFTLTEDGVEVGTYTSDKRGRITILYDFKQNAKYVLTETKTPDGFIGLPYPVEFQIDGNNDISWNQAEEGRWVDCHTVDISGEEEEEKEIVAYVNTYNKPVEFKVLKIDKDNQTKGLPGAHFALYRSVTSGIGEEIKDYIPMEGYEDIVSGIGGVLPKIDNTLEPGKYYLNETAAPTGYQGDTKTDIVFVVTERREIEFISPTGTETDISYKTDDVGEKVLYEVAIPNKRVGTQKLLTVTKEVDGKYGNKNKEFTFTFTVKGAKQSETFVWDKNGVRQSAKLHSGDTFRLKHGDSVIITLNNTRDVIISEDNEKYEPKFVLDTDTESDSDAQKTNSRTFTVNKDTTLSVTNTLDGEIPTGVWLPIGVLVGAGVILLLAIIAVLRRSRRYKKYAKER